MTNSIALPGALGITFIVLKLTGVISWSWWWVLWPFYGPLLVAAVVFVCVMVGYGLLWLVQR